MLPTSAQVPPTTQGRRVSRPVSAFERADALARAAASSTRGAARQRGLSRRTLRAWIARCRRDPDRPAQSTFLNGPEGTRALHRIVLAALFVFGVMGGAGAATLRTFFVLAGLSPWIACSESTLRRSAASMIDAIGAWGDATGQHLGDAGRGGPERLISIALDETWKRSMILVAMDTASGFVLAEVHAAARDAATWTATLSKAIGALPVKVVQAVADEAKGIAACVAGMLGVHRASDLFHGLHELGPVIGALHRKVAEAESAALASGAALRAARETAHSSTARAAHTAQRNTVRRLRERVDTAVACVRGLSAAFHPVDLATGERVEASAVRRRLEQYLARLDYAARESEVRATVLERIAKVLRLVPTWTASLSWWEQFEAAQREALGLPAALAAVVRDVVVPWAYLTHRRAVASHASERDALDAALAKVRARLSASTTWSSQSPQVRESLERWAGQTVAHFVRTSSCVEGRNGFLSLRYHHRRALPPALLKALTVIHNFHLRRDDGTTAAERLFGVPHDDLFEHLLQVIPPLPLPRTRAA